MHVHIEKINLSCLLLTAETLFHLITLVMNFLPSGCHPSRAYDQSACDIHEIRGATAARGVRHTTFKPWQKQEPSSAASFELLDSVDQGALLPPDELVYGARPEQSRGGHPPPGPVRHPFGLRVDHTRGEEKEDTGKQEQVEERQERVIEHWWDLTGGTSGREGLEISAGPSLTSNIGKRPLVFFFICVNGFAANSFV